MMGRLIRRMIVPERARALLALLLAVLMTASLLPAGAFAAEAGPESASPQESAAETVIGVNRGGRFAMPLKRAAGVSVSVGTTWVDDDETARPDSVAVQLACDSMAYGDAVSLTEENGWAYEWAGLPANHTYTVRLAGTAPDGYKSDVRTGKDSSDGRVAYDIVNTYVGERTKFDAVAKVAWDDGGSERRPDTFSVRLIRDSSVYDTVSLSDDNDWTYEWQGLDSKYLWRVEAVDAAPSGYETRITSDLVKLEGKRERQTWNIDNTLVKSGSTDVVARIHWDEPAGSPRPVSVRLWLMCDGKDYGSFVSLSDANGWTYRWTGLDDWHDWTVQLMDDLPKGYVPRITMTEEGDDESRICDITCRYMLEPGTVDVTAAASWQGDEPDERPDALTVQLMCDGDAYGTLVKLTAGNGWAHTWTGLTSNCAWTVELVKENSNNTVSFGISPDGYVTGITTETGIGANGREHATWNFRNVRSGPPPTTEMTVRIHWKNDSSILRPMSVSASIYRDDATRADRSLSLSTNGGWAATVSGLDGERSWSSVLEPPDGYICESSVRSELSEDGTLRMAYDYTLTYAVEPRVTSMKVKAVWNDDGSTRPEKLGVMLSVNGYTQSDTTVYLSESNGWTYEWTDLDGRVPCSVVLASSLPAGYYTRITTDPDDGSAWNVTCTYNESKPASKLTINVHWVNDTPETRPSSVPIHAYQVGWSYSRLTVENGYDGNRLDDVWTCKWTIKNSVKACTLSIGSSSGLKGYITDMTVSSSISENGIETIVCDITNTYALAGRPDARRTVKVVWEDEDESKLPDRLKVGLMKGTSQHAHAFLDGSGGWSHTWENLNGSYEWTVRLLDAVPDGYVAKLSADPDDSSTLVLTFTYVGEKPVTDIVVKCAWKGGTEGAGPISYRLLRDGAPYGSSYYSMSSSDPVKEWTGLDSRYTWTVKTYGSAPAGCIYEVTSELAVGTDGRERVTWTVTCVYIGEVSATTDMKVNVTWVGDDESIRPDSIRIVCLRDGSISESAYVSEKSGWACEWTGLSGDYIWIATPSSWPPLPVGYAYRTTVETSVSDDGRQLVTCDIVIAYDASAIPLPVDVSVSMVWEDGGEARPDSVNVSLAYYNPASGGSGYYETVSLSGNNGWSYEWNELDGTREWTLSMDVLSRLAGMGYVPRLTTESVTDGDMRKHITYRIVNTYERTHTVDVTARASWIGDEGTDARPGYIGVWLMRDGARYDNKRLLNQNNGWTYAWTGLDSRFTWTVELDGYPPKGYATDVTLSSETAGGAEESLTFDIVNTYMEESPGSVDMIVNLTWEEGEVPCELPEYVNFDIMCDGLHMQTSSLSGSKGWTYKLTGLDGRYEWDIAITDVDKNYHSSNDYSFSTPSRSEISEADGRTRLVFDIVGSCVSVPDIDKTDLIVTNVWVDAFGDSRPDYSLDVRLLRDGEPYGSVESLNAENDWTYKWSDLDVSHAWSAELAGPPPAGYESSTKTETYRIGSGAYVLCGIASVYDDMTRGYGPGEMFVPSYFAARKVWFDDGEAGRPDMISVSMIDIKDSSNDRSFSLYKVSNWRYLWYGADGSYSYKTTVDSTDGYVCKTMSDNGVYFIANIRELDGQDPGFSLPRTGGIGTANIMMVGSVLVLASWLAIASARRRRNAFR